MKYMASGRLNQTRVAHQPLIYFSLGQVEEKRRLGLESRCEVEVEKGF